MVALLNGLGGPAGFGENEGPDFDDDFVGPIDLTPVFEEGINVFGTRLDRVWINSNGNLTFDGPFTQYFPEDIDTLRTAGLYPFWSDVNVDTPRVEASPGGTSRGTNAIWYDIDPEGGTFTVTWDDVRPFNAGPDDDFYDGFDDGFDYFNNGDSVAAFQIRLRDISDEPGRLPGDLEVELRYEAVEWTSGIGGADEALARIGFTIGDGSSFFELPASGDDAALRALPDLGPIRFTFDELGIRGEGAAPVIRGTDGDDLLLGTDAADALVAGLGQDTIRPGLGADEIILEGGGKVVAGSAAELFDDTLRGAFWDDALFFEGETFGAADVTIAEDGRTILFDLDGDGTAEGSVASDVGIGGGAFLTANVADGTFVGYVRDLPDLAEGQAVADPGRLAGDALTESYLSGDGASAFRLTLNGVSMPDPGTAIGVYEVDPSGALRDARLVTPDLAADLAALPGASFVVEGVEASHRMGVFLLNAEDPAALDRGDLALVNQLGEAATLDDRNFVFAVQDGAVVAGDLIHAFDPVLNQDLRQHVLIARDPDAPGLTLAFEDAPFYDTGDFADVVLSVERIATEML